MMDVQIRGEAIKVMHRVPLDDLSGYSAGTGTTDGAFIIHIDRRNNATRDFLLVSPQHELVCAQVATAYHERVRRQLRRLDWDPTTPSAKILITLLSQTLPVGTQPHRCQDDQASPRKTPHPSSQKLALLVSEFSAYEWTVESCDSYVHEQFEGRRKEDVRMHRGDLAHAKAQAALRLQQSVVQHYRSFIRTSNEAAEVDEDLSLLRKQLMRLGYTIASLTETSFSCPDVASDDGVASDVSRIQSSELRAGSVSVAREQRILALLTTGGPCTLGVRHLRHLVKSAMGTQHLHDSEVIVRQGELVSLLTMIETGECPHQTRVKGSAPIKRLSKGHCLGHTQLMASDANHMNSIATVAAVGGPCTVLSFSRANNDAAAVSERSMQQQHCLTDLLGLMLVFGLAGLARLTWQQTSSKLCSWSSTYCWLDGSEHIATA